MKLIDKIINTLGNYGIVINNIHKLKNEEQVVYTKDMILFINEIEQSIGISFFASTIPEDVSNLTLIIKNIKDSTLFIMESFIFDENNEYISGNKAFKLLKELNKNKIEQRIIKNQHYNHILKSHKGREC